MANNNDLATLLEKYAIAQEMLSTKDGEQSIVAKIMEEIPIMLNGIMDNIGDNPDDISMDDLLTFVLAMKHFNEEIKPIYLRVLINKEAKNENQS